MSQRIVHLDHSGIDPVEHDAPIITTDLGTIGIYAATRPAKLAAGLAETGGAGKFLERKTRSNGRVYFIRFQQRVAE